MGSESRLKPGERFDFVEWVGPLLVKSVPQEVKWRLPLITLFGPQFGDFDSRYCRPVRPRNANPRDLEAELTRLGAPSTCRAIQLFSADPNPSNSDDRYFDEGAELPLAVALKIAVDLNDGQEQMIGCLAGRLLYTQTHNYDRMIVYRPS